MQASPEIKRLVETLSTDPAETSAQEKYQAILARKLYENDCFLQCVLLRRETHRGGSTVQSAQNTADANFERMLSHAR